MDIQSRTLHPGENLTLQHGNDESLVVVIGSGGGCTLRIAGHVAGIWIPLWGSLHLTSGDRNWTLRKGELRTAESFTKATAVGYRKALWVGWFGAPAAWQRAFGSAWDVPALETLLLPACYRADLELRRRALALARSTRRSLQDASEHALLDGVIALQGDLPEAIARCPGRNCAQRRQAFLRLERVRKYLGDNCHLQLDNSSLARMANFSSGYFLRAFQAVYRETPHAYLVNQRLQRARHLLRSSGLAINEVASASGFGNRCAFARLFRKRFGTTAGAARRNAHALP